VQLNGLEIAAASAVIALGSLVQGGIGFGSLLIAAPLLVLIEPALVPGPALLSGFVLALLIAGRDRGGLEWRSVGWALGGRIPGSAVGALLLTVLPADGFPLLVGITVLGGVLASVTRLRLRPTRVTLTAAGFVSGITGTTTSVGGPPMALVYQHRAGEQLRATLSGFFVMGSLLSAATLALVGRFGAREIELGLLLLPATIAGFAVSGPLARSLDRGYTRAAVLGLSAGSGLVLILGRAG
jgi:uncharacterized membrane protein YfcA